MAKPQSQSGSAAPATTAPISGQEQRTHLKQRLNTECGPFINDICKFILSNNQQHECSDLQERNIHAITGPKGLTYMLLAVPSHKVNDSSLGETVRAGNAGGKGEMSQGMMYQRVDPCDKEGQDILTAFRVAGAIRDVDPATGPPATNPNDGLFPAQTSFPAVNLTSKGRERAETQPMSSFVSSDDGTEEEDDDLSNEPRQKPKYTLRQIKVNDVASSYYFMFEALSQKGLKRFLQSVIKECHPGKQTKHPYNGGCKPEKPSDDYDKANPGCNSAPRWWPNQQGWHLRDGTACRHKEVHHVMKPERQHLAQHIITLEQPVGDENEYDFSLERLMTVAERVITEKDLPPGADKILECIFSARKLQERYFRGEIDGDAILHVYMTDPNRPRSAKRAKTGADEPPAKKQKPSRGETRRDLPSRPRADTEMTSTRPGSERAFRPSPLDTATAIESVKGRQLSQSSASSSSSMSSDGSDMMTMFDVDGVSRSREDSAVGLPQSPSTGAEHYISPLAQLNRRVQAPGLHFQTSQPSDPLSISSSQDHSSASVDSKAFLRPQAGAKPLATVQVVPKNRHSPFSSAGASHTGFDGYGNINWLNFDVNHNPLAGTPSSFLDANDGAGLMTALMAGDNDAYLRHPDWESVQWDINHYNHDHFHAGPNGQQNGEYMLLDPPLACNMASTAQGSFRSDGGFDEVMNGYPWLQNNVKTEPLENWQF